MNFITVDNIDILELKIYHQFRDKALSVDNSFVADSPKVVNLLLKRELQIHSILATKEYYEMYEELIIGKNIPKLFVASKELMQKIVGHKLHHNVMMHGKRPDSISLNKLGNNIIMLDEISSTENIGSIARSAAAIGVDSYLLPIQGPHPWSRRSLRVSMGHISLLKTHIYLDIEDTILNLKEQGYRVYAAEVTKDSTPLYNVVPTNKWVILMGHEGLGISKEVLELCDEVVSIEMEKGIMSFNVSVAASLMMYHFKHT